MIELSFTDPWFFLAAVPFLFLFLLLRYRKAWLYHSRQGDAREVKGLKEVLRWLPKIFLVSAVILVTVAFTHLVGGEFEQEFAFDGREIMLVVDTSQSMTGKAMETIKEVLSDFAERRARYQDLVGVSVYAGTGRGKYQGKAAIVLLPTYDSRHIERAIQRIKAKEMVGVYTSIGEGLFISLIALLDKEMGDELDITRLKDSLVSRDKTYALELVKYIKRTKEEELKNKVLVLFTDGAYNSGIDPADVFWLMHQERLGIRTYFVAVEPSSGTGLSAQEQAQRKRAIIRGVPGTGGQYFEAVEMDEVREFYAEIDRIEEAKTVVEFKTRQKDLYFWPVAIALILIGTMVVVETIWLKIL